jgi:peptidyl-tRNA hydrolase
MAQQSNITYCTIRDAGRTQIAAGSMTVVGIGPIPTHKAKFLSQLKPF